MREEIYTLAAAIVAPSEEEKALLELLSAAAEQELAAALRPGITVDTCREAFLCAAGYLAAAGVLESRGNQAEQFSAGEVSIRTGGAESRGVGLRALARQLMAPYSEGGSSAFPSGGCRDEECFRTRPPGLRAVGGYPPR